MAPPDKETSKWRGEREGGKGGGARPALFTIRASSAPLSLLYLHHSPRCSPPRPNLNNSFGGAVGRRRAPNKIASTRYPSPSSSFFPSFRFFDFDRPSRHRSSRIKFFLAVPPRESSARCVRLRWMEFLSLPSNITILVPSRKINLHLRVVFLFLLRSKRSKIAEYVFKVYLSELLRGPLGRDLFQFRSDIYEL